MQDENREKLTEEPREVVQWYVRPEGREVVDYYVQPRPMPAGAAPPPPPPGTGLFCYRIVTGKGNAIAHCPANEPTRENKTLPARGPVRPVGRVQPPVG